MEGLMFWEYRYLLLAVVIVFLIYQFEWQRSKVIIFALMFQARRLYGENLLKSGKEQEDWVLGKAEITLPFAVRLFLNSDVLRSIIHEMYVSLDKYSYSKNDQTISKGKTL